MDIRRFIARTLIVIGLVALALLLWMLRDVLVLAFAAVILAVVMVAPAGWIAKTTGIAQHWAVTLVAVVVILGVAAVIWLAGTQVTSQIGELKAGIPRGLDALEAQLGLDLPELNELTPDQSEGWITRLFGTVASWSWTVLSALTTLVLVVLAGYFLAIAPKTYKAGLVELVPPSRRSEADNALTECGAALRLWLRGQLISMAIVGTLVGLGTWLLGVPAPIALGLVAAVLEFIPLFGPFLAAVPAVLLALTVGPTTALWTLVLYGAIQQVESNVIIPQVQKQMVHIPPALFVFSVLAFGILFGVLGVLVAAPMTVAVFVLVKSLYRKETLGESVQLPADDS